MFACGKALNFALLYFQYIRRISNKLKDLQPACYMNFLGLGRLSQAEEYLSQAMWTVTKMPECSNHIKSKLYRNLGLLHAAKGEYDEALRHLADDVSTMECLSITNTVIMK